MYIDKSAKKGVNLGQHTRSKDISISSLSDFEIKKEISDKQLIVKKSKLSDQNNDYQVTIIVPQAAKDFYQTSLSFENSVTGESLKIPVKFNPQDLSGKVETSEPKVSEKGWASQEEAPKQKSNDFDEGGPSFTAYLIFGFVILVVLLICDSQVSIIYIKTLIFQGFFRGLN